MRTPLEISGWTHPTPNTWILHFVWPDKWTVEILTARVTEGVEQ